MVNLQGASGKNLDGYFPSSALICVICGWQFLNQELLQMGGICLENGREMRILSA